MSGGPSRRILYLTGFFPPEVIAKRSGGVACALAREGHHVTVLTRWPSKLTGDPYEAGELARADESLPPGVTVIRLRVVERRSAGLWWRVLSQVSFAARAAARAAVLGFRHDVVLAYTPPPFTGLAAWIGAKVSRRPLVLEVQDLYPAQALALGLVRPGLVSKVAEWVERVLYRGATRLVLVTEGYREHAVEVGADPTRIRVVPNSCDTEAFHPGVEPMGAAWERARFTALFAGTVGLAQGSEVVVSAAEALRDRPDIGFEVWGGGARYEQLRRSAEERGLRNVRFGPAVPHRDMPRVMARADVLLLTLHPGPVFARVVPSKLSEYLAMGRPVVAAARGAVAALLAEAGAGVAVDPLDGAGLARALARLADAPADRLEMGRRARSTAERRFGHDTVVAAFTAVVAEAASD